MLRSQAILKIESDLPWVNKALNFVARGADFIAPTPVHFFSHGSTMMLGEESESATYWKKAGDEALANSIKGVIMMVSLANLLHSLLNSVSRVPIGMQQATG
jgi:hypothetical protein